jgi:hypothetical protein
MRSPILAMAWETWGSHRRAWWMILGAVPVFALLSHLSAGALGESEGLRFLSFFPLLLSLLFAASTLNVTERDRRKSFAGFPERLFTLPVRTSVLVTCPMVCGVLSVVGLYLAWVKLVYEPAGIHYLVRWPATLLAAGMILYQSIIWCLAGFRFTRLIILSFGLSFLVAVGCLPYALASESDRRLEWLLTGLLGALACVAYGAALVAVENQRRGGGRGWRWWRAPARHVAMALPRRRRDFGSPESALLWLEWHRAGLVLPFGVLLTLVLIVGPAARLSGRGPEATARTAVWMAILPIVLAIPVGKGIAKPAFWSVELGLPAFLSTRPVTNGQIVAAKMRAAAFSTLLAWALLLVAAPIWLWLAGDLNDLRSFWGTFCAIYSSPARWAIPILALFAAVVLTWNFMIGSIWCGMSGRPLLYSGAVVLSAVCFVCMLILLTWFMDSPGRHREVFWAMLPWLPWTLAAFFILKAWLAAGAFWRARQCGIVTFGTAGRYLCAWIVGTCCLVVLGWLMSPRVEWFRDLLCLAALLACPIARVGAAPLAVARNRHR